MMFFENSSARALSYILSLVSYNPIYLRGGGRMVLQDNEGLNTNFF